MTSSFDTHVQQQSSQPNSISGWAVWTVFCFLSLFAVTQPALAAVYLPSQPTFSPVSVGSTSPSFPVTLYAQNSGVAGTPVAYTEGASDQSVAEFTIASAGSCDGNPNLTQGASCTVQVTFSPHFPGLRHGAIVLKDSNGGFLASTLISGLGQGGLPVLVPGQITTVVGNGQWFYQRDNVPATQASIYLPAGLAVDAAGDLYLADSINNRIRRVDATTQQITTVAGDGNAGTSGDGNAATSAQITSPTGIALDGAGNLYIADTGNNTIRRVDAVTKIITVIAGTPGVSGYAGDEHAATSAQLNAPQGVAITASGDILIADTDNNVIREVTIADNQIHTIAGKGTAGFSGDGLSPMDAELDSPSGIAIRADGAIAIADLGNNCVRLMTSDNKIQTVAGNTSPGYMGDGHAATSAELQGPAAVAFDPAGDLYIADSVNNTIRLVDSSDGIISTIAGSPASDRYFGDGGPSKDATMHGPDALVFDAAGNLWLSDRFNNRVREINGSVLVLSSLPSMKVGKTSAAIAEQMINAGNTDLHLNSPVLQQTDLDPSTTTCSQLTLPLGTFCKMGLEFAPTTVGTNVTGSVTWTSDAPGVKPVDYLSGPVLSVEPTSTAITADVNPGLLGQPVTLTATVTSDDKNRTGTVDFVEGSTTWCQGVPLGADGTAICRIQSLSLGNHNFTANYSGDNNNAASSSPTFQEAIKQQAALAIGVSSSPAVVTNTVTISISAADSTGTPTGTVTFFDGSTTLQTVTLDGNGNGSWSTNALTVGQHDLSAQYSGDSANVSGKSGVITLQVVRANTATVLSSSSSNATVGATVNLTASVVSNNGPAPTGNVQFMDGATVFGSVPIDSNGSASLLVSTLSPGTHHLTAVYVGDADNANSTSTPLTEQIQQIGTTTTLGADLDPADAGAVVHFTAIVGMTAGATADGQLTGTVTFTDGSATIGSAGINASGQATLALSTLSVGSHPIVATFSGNTNYASDDSNVLNEVVRQTATAVSLTAASASTLMGKTASFTAQVTSPTTVPTGTIIWKDGVNVIGSSSLDAHGDASFATQSLSAGMHAITAVYGGDASFLQATSPAVQLRVDLAQPILTLTGASTVFEAGTDARFTSVLATNGVTPSGDLTLLDGNASISTNPVSAAGSFSFTTSSLAVGVHLLTARYSGDSNNAATSSAVFSVTVQPAATTTTLISSSNPLTQGESLSLTATVRSNGPNAGNSVSFFDGSTLLSTVPLNTGVAVLVGPKLTLGLHTLTATYSGDTNHAASTSSPLAQLVVQSASAAIASSINPSVSGQSITFTGVVSGSPAPTGSLAFRDNGTELATVPLDLQGHASFSTASLGVGTHDITMMYSGDQNFASLSAQLKQVVNNATTSITLGANANPATFGDVLTLSATVGSNGGVATGQVIFSEAGKTLGSAVLDTTARAAFATASLPPGTHTIIASYLGDGKANASVSQPLTLAVKQRTTLALRSDANPAQTLSQINLSATVTNAGAASTTGTVTFSEGAAVLGVVSINSAGNAQLTLDQLSAGSHKITSSYSGDEANFASGSSEYTQVVQVRPTSTTITGTSTDKDNPQQVTLIAVVHGSGSLPPSGMVNFTDGTITLGAASVDATGVATVTVIFNTPTQSLSASYGGDPSYGPSQSAPTPITAGTPAQFTLSLSDETLSVASHQRTTVTVTLASVKGFTDNIALGCLGLPYAATCTFDHSQLKLNADGSVTTSLTLDTGNPLGAGSSTKAETHDAQKVVLCLSPLGLLLSLRKRKGRHNKLPALLGILIALLVSTGGLAGCSGLQMSGTPPGTYSFRVIGTGQGSNVTETKAITLVVTQ